MKPQCADEKKLPPPSRVARRYFDINGDFDENVPVLAAGEGYTYQPRYHFDSLRLQETYLEEASADDESGRERTVPSLSSSTKPLHA